MAEGDCIDFRYGDEEEHVARFFIGRPVSPIEAFVSLDKEEFVKVADCSVRQV